MHQGDLHLLAGTQRVINRRTRNNLAIPSNKQSGQIITLSHNLLSIMYCFYQIEVFYLPFSDHLGSGDRGIGRLYPNVKVTKPTVAMKLLPIRYHVRDAAIRQVCSASHSLRSLEHLEKISPALCPRWIQELSFTVSTLAR